MFDDGDRSATGGLRALTLAEFLERKLPPREFVLDPIIPTQGLVMLYAKRGVGKTHLALGIACAVASGIPVLRWNAPKPRRVLYLDGEMPGTAMQERLRALRTAAGGDPPSLDNLRIVTPDLCLDPIPNLASLEGQAQVEPLLNGVELLVIDNLATLARFGKENESESWRPIQTWLLDLRRRGISVLLVHHAGKGGQQRGTSSREDILDTVINLAHPLDYKPTEGARFIVSLDKARGIAGEAASPFEAQLELLDGRADWKMSDAADHIGKKIIELKEAGLSLASIGKDVGLSKSEVHRRLERTQQQPHA